MEEIRKALKEVVIRKGDDIHAKKIIADLRNGDKL